MDYLNQLVENIKRFYFFFENKWYDLLDKVDEKIPIYPVIDKVDSVIPSFILLLLMILFFIILAGYLIQFSTPFEVTIKTIDSSTKDPISNVSLKAIIDDVGFEGNTNSQGIVIWNISGVSHNIYFEILNILTGTKEKDSVIELSATKEGYRDFSDTFYSGKKHTISLSPIPDEEPPEVYFANKTTVRVIDRSSREVIIDNTNQAYILFSCNNKSMEPRKVRSNSGYFDLEETNCQFKVEEVYSPGYVVLTNSRILPKEEDMHTIELNRMANNTGTAKIWVFEDGNNDAPIPGAAVTLLDQETVLTNNSGFAEIKDITPGEYNITVTKTGYNPILSSDNIKINVIANKISEKELFLIPGEQRKINIKVKDGNNQKIPNAEINVYGIDAQGFATDLIKKGMTDSNGFFIFDGLTQITPEVIVVIDKNEYLIKIIKEQTQALEDDPIDVIIELADATNSGFAEIKIESISGGILKRPLKDAIATILIDEIHGVKRVPADYKKTNSSGNAKFSRLPIDLDYRARGSFDAIRQTTQEKKKLDANKTIYFELELNFDTSKIIIELKNRQNQVISNGEIKLFMLDSDLKKVDLKETLTFSNGKYESNFYSKEFNYHIEITAPGYIGDSITINKKEDPLKTGENHFTKILVFAGQCTDLEEDECNDTEGCIFEDGVCKLSDDPLMGAISINFDKIYSVNDSLWNNQTSIDMIHKNETYRAKIDIRTLRTDFNYLSVLGMVRTTNATIKNIFINPQIYNHEKNTMSCDNSGQDDADTRDETYYIRSTETGGPDNCFIDDQKIIGGAKWEGEDGNYLPSKSTYSIMIDFEVNSNDRVIFEFRAKQNSSEQGSSETILKSHEALVGVPLFPGLYLGANINDQEVIFQAQENENIRISEEVQGIFKEERTLNLNIFNANNSDISNASVSVHSHVGPVHTFKKNEPRGFVQFLDNQNWVRNKVINNSLSISANSSEELSVTFRNNKRSSTDYLVIAIDNGSEEKLYFIDIRTSGKIIVTTGTDFLTGVPNQKFSRRIMPPQSPAGTDWYSDWDPKIIDGSIKIYNNSDEEIKEFSLGEGSNHISDDSKSFEVELPGVFVVGDYLVLEIQAKENEDDELYEPYTRKFRAGSGGSQDRSLSCVTIDSLSPNATEDRIYNLAWGSNTTLTITNNCLREVMLITETGLECKYSYNQNACNTYERLNSGESLIIELTGKNITYNPDEGAPNFTDLLGYFPVIVKAKFIDRAHLSNAAYYSINLSSNTSCFGLDGNPIFDFTNSTSQQISITSHCQYKGINDYYIPTIDLRAFGYDILRQTNESIGNEEFTVFVELDGALREFEEKEEARQVYSNTYFTFAGDVPSENIEDLDNGLKRYTFNFDFENELNMYNNLLEEGWYFDRMQIRIIDTDFYSPDRFGARIDGDIKVTYENNETISFEPVGNFELGFNATGNARIYQQHVDDTSGEDFFGEGLIVAAPIDFEGVFFAGLFYQPIPEGKIRNVEISFIAEDVFKEDSLNPFLEFSVWPRLNYVHKYLVEKEPSEDITPNRINFGSYSIPQIPGTNYIVTTMEGLKEAGIFEDEEFVSRFNPNLTGIVTDNDRVITWIENGFLYARYIGENPFRQNDNKLVGTISRIIRSGTSYGLVTAIDYVQPTPGKIISGDTDQVIK